jgi:peptide/nickel transport system permease protein
MRLARFVRRNPSLIVGGIIIATIVLLALLAPLVSTHGVEQMDMRNRFAGPSMAHLLGTDNFGRDLWSRMVHGGRISLAIALVSVLSAAAIGTTVGLVAGYFGGWVDLLAMRICDVFLGFPALVLILAIVAVLGPGVANVTIGLIVVLWADYARIVRAATLSIREMPFVAAARALGATDTRILAREILPNVFGPVVVLATLGFGTAIVAESALSFLGFGVPPPTPTWGWTLAYGTRFLRQDPWLSTVAGLAIMITVLGFNLLGDGLRDLIDPRRLARETGSKPKPGARSP